MLTLWVLILLNPVPGVNDTRATLRTIAANTSANTYAPFPSTDGQNIDIPACQFTVSMQGNAPDVASRVSARA